MGSNHTYFNQNVSQTSSNGLLSFSSYSDQHIHTQFCNTLNCSFEYWLSNFVLPSDWGEIFINVHSSTVQTFQITWTLWEASFLNFLLLIIICCAQRQRNKSEIFIKMLCLFVKWYRSKFAQVSTRCIVDSLHVNWSIHRYFFLLNWLWLWLWLNAATVQTRPL